MGDETPKKIARELVDSVRRNATIDSSEKEQVRALMRAAIKRLLKVHEGAPLVVVSISEDEDPRAWNAFISKNAMSWPQYLDDRHKIAALFDLNAVPAYVLLDGEGIERLRVQNTGLQDARTLAEEIDKRLRIAAAPR